jgi:2-C-methyl-D-erythritol 4-phosphate cytidylyltransferase
MSDSDSAGSLGAVVTIVVATAPGATAHTRALLWRSVAGQPLMAWTLGALAPLEHLRYCALITPLARHEDGFKSIQNAAPAPMNAVIPTADDTWRCAFASIADIPVPYNWLIIVDATLPLITADCLRDGLRAAARTGVAIAGEPVKETLKRVQGQTVIETPPRGNLRRLLSPVIFRREALERALDGYDPASTAAHDLIAFAQLAGAPLTVFDAGYPGVRVTNDADLAIVETLLSQRQSETQP